MRIQRRLRFLSRSSTDGDTTKLRCALWALDLRALPHVALAFCSNYALKIVGICERGQSISHDFAEDGFARGSFRVAGRALKSSEVGTGFCDERTCITRVSRFLSRIVRGGCRAGRKNGSNRKEEGESHDGTSTLKMMQSPGELPPEPIACTRQSSVISQNPPEPQGVFGSFHHELGPRRMRFPVREGSGR